MKTMNALVNSFSLSACLIGGLLSVSTASATTIAAGQVNFGGTVTVSTGGVFFANGAGTAHIIDPGGPDTGGYAGLSAGTIQDLTGPAVTGPVNIPHFLTFTVTGGTVFFDLQNIAPGIGTNAACGSNAVGNVCTPTGSPFTLIQRTAGQVEIDFSVTGAAYTGTVATGSDPTTGLFTTQNLLPGTITGVLAAVSSASGITNSFSATFASVVVPEPGTLSMIFAGAGLLGMGFLKRKRRS